MVHVLDLLGCVVHDRTTESALEATPAAIRQFLDFLARHGENLDPGGRFTTRVAEHVMEGSWLGYGDPTPGFSRDFEPLPPQILEQGVRRLTWMKEDLVHRLDHLTDRELAEIPEHGRALGAILEHLGESQVVYVRYLVGPLEGASPMLRQLRAGGVNAVQILARLFDLHLQRLAGLSAEERELIVPHGQVRWTAHRALRRSLEHAWEHLLEIDARLEP